MNWLTMLAGPLSELTLVLPVLGTIMLLGSLFISTVALRRSRTLARSSAALSTELAVFKDAAVSLGLHLDRRMAMPSAGVPRAGAASGNAAMSGTSSDAPNTSVQDRRVPSSHGVHLQPRHAPPSPVLSQPLHARELEPVPSSAPAIVPDTRRAFELARQGASIDDLVAACDVSRTEAGLMLAMSRRGRRVPGT